LIGDAIAKSKDRSRGDLVVAAVQGKRKGDGGAQQGLCCFLLFLVLFSLEAMAGHFIEKVIFKSAFLLSLAAKGRRRVDLALRFGF
jgi:hypothetical protein